MMSFRISPAWWPGLVLASPLVVPWLYRKNVRFRENREQAWKANREKISETDAMDLPALDFFELTAVVEWSAEEGFVGDAGVSYLIRTDQGTVLFDVGFGPERPAFRYNAERLGFDADGIDALVISHLHCDHMGGMGAQRARRITLPAGMVPASPRPCFLPDRAAAPGFLPRIVKKPELLPAGIATTGPLARSLFFFGYTNEQALVARIKDKGLVVVTGCGHPTIEVILEMVHRMSNEPVSAVAGGLHFPVTDGRGNRLGIRFQTVIGTGKPPWRRIGDRDLDRTISALNRTAPEQVLLSAHDTCGHALGRMENELAADTCIVTAGRAYRI